MAYKEIPVQLDSTIPINSLYNSRNRGEMITAHFPSLVWCQRFRFWEGNLNAGGGWGACGACGGVIVSTFGGVSSLDRLEGT